MPDIINFTLEGGSAISTPVDATLTQSGAAADAKATGDALKAANDAISANTQSVEAVNETLQTVLSAVDERLSEMMGRVWPIGSVWMSVYDDNPSAILGVGTWEQIRGRFIVANDELGAFAPNVEGGSMTHTHEIDPTALTVEQMPAHTHGTAVIGAEVRLGANVAKHSSAATTALMSAPASVTVDGQSVPNAAQAKAVSGAGYYVTGTKIDSYTGNRSFVLNASHAHEAAGSGAEHAHTAQDASSLPPYMTVYVWKRVS